ncbi:Hypothetical protein R9X50_00360900 [Acrodontium crateriforme]|uniref:Uncharacterized protein n=1 Tax=Acrodontium crateriforme TaxID=150365 RepID=A0AAQ3R7L8_9PEZI|nr:Hypothetical protein R9X50_00360900 [Acrodontium crateriforme]
MLPSILAVRSPPSHVVVSTPLQHLLCIHSLRAFCIVGISTGISLIVVLLHCNRSHASHRKTRSLAAVTDGNPRVSELPRTPPVKISRNHNDSSPQRVQVAMMILTQRSLNISKPDDVHGAIIEAWAEGYMVGSLIIMACVAFANMRRHVLLHKLILLELVLAMFHGTFIFTNPPVYNWYLSTTAIFLNISWSLHNVIAWIKNKPFLSRWGSRFYIGTVILVQPYWVLEITANFLYFSGKSDLFVHTRPYEALFRDPWWIFTVINLFWNIKTRYDFGYIEIMRVSPRFAVLMGSMVLSIAFIVCDILSVTHAIRAGGLPDGVNPFWKLALVFKCLTDTIILDDFKTALDRLKQYKMQRLDSALADTLNFDGYRGYFHDVEQAREIKKASRPISRPEMSNMAATDSTLDENEPMDFEAALRMEDKRGGPSSG